MKEKYYLFPIFIRIWHGLNGIGILLLIITGLSMQYSDPSRGFIHFSTAVRIHNICGLVITFNYLIFLIGNIITPNGKHYRLVWKGISKEIMAQFRYYMFGMFRHEQPPFPISEERKFNPLQKLSYSWVMYLFVPLIVLTGLALMFPELIVINKIFGSSSILFTDIIHIIVGFIISIFLIVHLYLCTFGIRKHNNFKSIINGWHYAE